MYQKTHSTLHCSGVVVKLKPNAGTPLKKPGRSRAFQFYLQAI